MISNKLIQAYRKATQNINRAVEKEIDSFEMDYDKVVQKFWIFFRDEKYECVIIKHANKYNYDIKIHSNIDVIYWGMFRFSEHTGKAIIYDLKVLNI